MRWGMRLSLPPCPDGPPVLPCHRRPRGERMVGRKLAAELIGTFWLVFGGCGSAVLAAAFMPTTNLGIGLVGVSLAFGLTVLTGAYALGHISGGHFNPAITIGLVAGKRFEIRDAIPYIIAQLVGGILGASVLAVIA